MNGIIHNKEPPKSIFNWNHISNELTEEQIEELKSYYKTYHKKCWAYKQAVKRLKKWKLLWNSLSIVFASGGFASSIATGGISLITISTVALLIQGWMNHKNLDLKIQNCTYAYQSYQHLLNEIKDMMRSGNFNSSLLGLLMSPCRHKNIRITQVGVTTNFIGYFALFYTIIHMRLKSKVIYLA